MGTGLTFLPCRTRSSLIHVIEMADFNARHNEMEGCGWLKLRAQLSRKMKAGPRGPCFLFLYFITAAWRVCTEVKHASSAHCERLCVDLHPAAATSDTPLLVWMLDPPSRRIPSSFICYHCTVALASLLEALQRASVQMRSWRASPSAFTAHVSATDGGHN